MKKNSSFFLQNSTSGYRDPEVGSIFANISAKTKYFSKIFWGFDRGLGTIDSCKKPDIENLMVVSL